MANLTIPIPNNFQRLDNRPLDSTSTFETYSGMTEYLNNGTRYPGQIVTCNEKEGSIFILNSGGTDFKENISNEYILGKNEINGLGVMITQGKSNKYIILTNGSNVVGGDLSDMYLDNIDGLKKCSVIISNTIYNLTIDSSNIISTINSGNNIWNMESGQYRYYINNIGHYINSHNCGSNGISNHIENCEISNIFGNNNYLGNTYNSNCFGTNNGMYVQSAGTIDYSNVYGFNNAIVSNSGYMSKINVFGNENYITFSDVPEGVSGINIIGNGIILDITSSNYNRYAGFTTIFGLIAPSPFETLRYSTNNQMIVCDGYGRIYKSYQRDNVFGGGGTYSNSLTIAYTNYRYLHLTAPISVTGTTLTVDRANITNAITGSYIINFSQTCTVTFSQATYMNSSIVLNQTPISREAAANTFKFIAGSYEFSERYDGTRFRLKAELQS